MDWKIAGLGRMMASQGHLPMFLCAGLTLSISAARAETVIDGTVDQLRIEARQAPVGEIFQALQSKFGVTIKGQSQLDWVVDGTFTGPLSSVLRRILKDENYIIGVNENNATLVVIAPHQGRPPRDGAPGAGGNAPTPVLGAPGVAGNMPPGIQPGLPGGRNSRF
jgi:hypothetical protein